VKKPSRSIRVRRILWLLIFIFITTIYFANRIFAQPKVTDAQNPLYVDPASRDFSQNPKLLQRIEANPHGYFRFINIPFSEDVCKLFADTLPGTPSFNLHGDAHIEQYAVTDLGRGLTDFDDSSTGPAVIDLLRFGVSLRLTCMINGWEDKADDLFQTFLLGYRTAITHPETEAPEPALVTKIQKKFKYDREAYFKWIATMMTPMPDEEREGLIAALQPYVEVMLTENNDMPENFFKITDVGYLHMGIGSALDLKYLVRIHGATDDPRDDVVLEVKEVRDLSGIDCITITRKNDPFRVLLGQARIAYQPYKYLGYIRFHEKTFWIHSWVDNYKEINVTKSFKSVHDLAEVVYDIGVQLGKGHPKQIASPFDVQLRKEQLLFLEKHENKIKKSCRYLTHLTVQAWKEFCANISKSTQKSPQPQ